MNEATWCTKCSGYKDDGYIQWAGTGTVPRCNCQNPLRNQVQKQYIQYLPDFSFNGMVPVDGKTQIFADKINEIIQYLNNL